MTQISRHSVIDYSKRIEYLQSELDALRVKVEMTTGIVEKPNGLPADAVRCSTICGLLGIKRVTLSTWIARGHINVWVISHKERYVSESEVRSRLDRVLAEN